MVTYINNFLKYKDLLKELVIRDIKVKYKRSVLGLLWSLLNPLLMMIVITIVFSNLFKTDIKNFPVYLLTGQIIFGFFSEATNAAMISITGNASLIKKVYIPKYIFPVSKVLASFVNLMFSLIAVILVMIFTQVKLNFVMLLFPIPLVFIMFFTTGIGLVLAALTVFFRDTLHLYGVILTIWLYLTPIFYPISIIPERYRTLVAFNPMYYFIDYFRQIVLYSKIPNMNLTLICSSTSIITLAIGLFIFYKSQNKFVLYI